MGGASIMIQVIQFSTLVFPNPWLECMTFILAYTIETVIGMGEINDTLVFKHFPNYFGIFSFISDDCYVQISAARVEMLLTF